MAVADVAAAAEAELARASEAVMDENWLGSDTSDRLTTAVMKVLPPDVMVCVAVTSRVVKADAKVKAAGSAELVSVGLPMVV